MKTLNIAINGILKTVMASSSFVLFAVTFLQVVTRFILKSPLKWSQDIIRLCFVYIVFWGAAYCVKEKAHLNVDVFLTMLKPKMRKVVELIINIMLMAFMIFLIIFGFKFAQTGATQNAPYLPIPMSIYYLSVPTGACFMVYYMIQEIIIQMKNINNNKVDEGR